MAPSLPLLVVLGLAASALHVASASRSPKRGYVADGCRGMSCTDFSLLTGAAWRYDYNYEDPNCGNATTCPPDIANSFVPMSWCNKDINFPLPAYLNLSHVLGFNEPNNVHNCNEPASTVASQWASFAARFPSTTRLGSPATAGDGIPFFDEFFAACKSLYGPSGCNISFIAVHDYSCHPNTTLAYLQQVHERYGLPIWLTEFSCGDGADGKPTPDHIAFMKAVFPLLDAAPFVERYAWMSAHDGNGKRGLVTPTGPGGSDVLTELGQLFNTL